MTSKRKAIVIKIVKGVESATSGGMVGNFSYFSFGLFTFIWSLKIWC